MIQAQVKKKTKTTVYEQTESSNSYSSSASASPLAPTTTKSHLQRSLWASSKAKNGSNSSDESTSTSSFSSSDSDSEEQGQQDILFQNLPPNNNNRKQRKEIAFFNDTNNTSTTIHHKRHQTKLLLVSLIESLCQTYGDTPESTRKIFFTICQTLSSLGFIDSEFMDQVAGVRNTYHKAFEQLFYTAAQTVLQQQQSSASTVDGGGGAQQQQTRKLLTLDEQQDILKQKIQSLSNHQLSPLKYTLSIQNSRYENDFVQLTLLGKGGFASAWRAKNKLDDVEYAIKKIRLKNGDGYYDKIFREIKNLAKLEHQNVVRYYSSWLEYAPVMVDGTGKEEGEGEEEEEEEEEESCAVGATWLSTTDEEEETSDSVFHGQDPIFESSSASSMLEEDSFIQFGAASSHSNSHIKINQHSSGSNPTIKRFNNKHKNPCTNQKEMEASFSADTSSMQDDDTGGGSFILFIQMQLCPSTLHEYLKFRNQNPKAYFNQHQNIELFSQILHGCSYIHQAGLIHRDLKPSNIFLSTSKRKKKRISGGGCTTEEEEEEGGMMVPKIGDFGLAAAANILQRDDESVQGEELEEEEEEYGYAIEELSSSNNNSNSAAAMNVFNTETNSISSATTSSFIDMISSSYTSSSSSSSATKKQLQLQQKKPSSHNDKRTHRTSGVGTRTYAAPEQLSSLFYNEKADIYSLGIVLFELYNPFSTAMERANAIDNLKTTQQFPFGFVDQYPIVSHLILHMMHPDPSKRPTAQDILNHHPLFQQQQKELVREGACIVRSNSSSRASAREAIQQERHEREMKDMEDRYTQMKNEKEDLQRRLNELQSKLDDCQLLDSSSSSACYKTETMKKKKRQHSIHPEEDDLESHKKIEIDYPHAA